MGRSLLTNFILIFIVFSLLTGCQEEDLQTQPSVSSNSEKPSSDQAIEKRNNGHSDRKTLPLELKEDQFEFMIGWLNNETILYCENLNGAYVISSYHIYTGEKEEMYTSELPIIQAVLSPSKTKILIHTSPTIYEADVKIVSLQNDKLIFHDIIESSEISFTWNGYDESKIFAVAFYDDWSFSTYILNIEEQTRAETKVPYPFAIWQNSNSLLTLDWDHESPETTAPILSITNGESESVLNDRNFYFLYGWEGLFLAISLNKFDDSLTDFNFYNEKLELIQTIQFPYLTEYSSWEIPRFNLVADDMFFIVAPKTSGEADNYDGGFDLIKIDLKDGSQDILIENVANEPIQSSPDGNLILYGYQYEHVINVNNKNIERILIFN